MIDHQAGGQSGIGRTEVDEAIVDVIDGAKAIDLDQAAASKSEPRSADIDELPAGADGDVTCAQEIVDVRCAVNEHPAVAIIREGRQRKSLGGGEIEDGAVAEAG